MSKPTQREPEGCPRLASLLAMMTLVVCSISLAAEPKTDRQLYLPIDQMTLLLDGANQRVLLSRQEYEDLLEKAKPRESALAPVKTVVLDADYQMVVETGRARIAAQLDLEVLDDGLLAIPLELAEVGIERASLDDKPAAIGQAGPGRFTLFVTGHGRHRLALDLLVPVETSTSQQTIRFGLPRPAAARLRLQVPGNIEVKSGAQVVSRAVDEPAGVTRFELAPAPGVVTLVLSLNNRQLREQRLVIARSAMIDRLSPTDERLYASFSLNVLHRATEQFRFAVPEGFDIAEVESPQLARWTITGAGANRTLELTMRQPALGQTVVRVQAVRNGPPGEWRWPGLKPLDVAAHTGVAGVWLDRLLKIEQLTNKNLLGIDTAVVGNLLQQHAATDGRLVAAYYVPVDDSDLTGRVSRREAKRLYESQIALHASEALWRLQAQWTLAAEVEPWLDVDVRLPVDWSVEEVHDAEGNPLPWQRHAAEEGTIVRVTLPQGVREGTVTTVSLVARHTPADWVGRWTRREFKLPALSIADAEAKRGTLTISAGDDQTIEVSDSSALSPLPAVTGVSVPLICEGATPLLYQYYGPLPAAKFLVQRQSPQLSARSYSFYRISSNAINVHTEIVYDVQRAHTRQLAFVLSKSTPPTVVIRGLDNLALKEYGSTDRETDRVWNVSLVERRQGTLRLAVDYELPLSNEAAIEMNLPIVRFEGVAYQSGVLAVEGGADWNVIIAQHPKAVDAGELAGADQQPGRHLIGAFAFAGETPALAVKLDRPPEHALPAALVRQARYTTLVSAQGLSQTAVELLLRTKVSFLQVTLPTGIANGASTLWSAEIDGQTLKPQRQDSRLLVNLSATGDSRTRTLRLVYETPIARLDHGGRLDLPGVVLHVVNAADGSSFEVPVADVQWKLVLPSGYRVVHTAGTLSRSSQPQMLDQLAAMQVARVLATSIPVISSARESARFSTVASAPQSGVEFERDMDERVQGFDFPQKSEVAKSAADMPKSEAMPVDAIRGPQSAVGAKTASVNQVTEELNKSLQSPASQGTVSQMVVAEPKPGMVAGIPIQLDKEIGEKKQVSQDAGGKVTRLDLSGFRSLPIQIDATGDVVSFQSLGLAPRLDVTLADGSRFDTLACALAAVVFILGARLIQRRASDRFKFMALVAVLATLVPLVTGWHEATALVNPTFYACLWLLALELFVATARWCLTTGMLIGRRCCPRWLAKCAATAIVLAVSLAISPLSAQDPVNPKQPILVEVSEHETPVKIPDDVTVWLYEKATGLSVPQAEKALVPYQRYVELWNRAFPDRPLDVPPPADYAPAGAVYSATLDGAGLNGAEQLILRGRLEYDVYIDRRVEVLLPLVGGVMAQATVNGQPARLKVIAPEATTQRAAPLPQAMIAVLLEGKRRHTVEVLLRFNVERAAGWRIVAGRVPVHPATQLNLEIAEAHTEVRLKGTADLATRETRAPRETLSTAIKVDEPLRIEWRPKADAAQRDETLQAVSAATILVQEDGVRAAWNVELQFRGAAREQFRFSVPAGYQIEQVQGSNIRSWQSREVDGRREIEITLLAAATGKENVTLVLSRSLALGTQPQEIETPVLLVPDAALHQGGLTLLRSQVVEMKTTAAVGVSRVDLGRETNKLAEAFNASDRTPLGVTAVEAYRFSATPFTLRVSANVKSAKTVAEWQNMVIWTPQQASFVGSLVLRVTDRPLYAIELSVPTTLELENLEGPDGFEWSTQANQDRQTVRVFFPTGQSGAVTLRLLGRLRLAAPTTEVAIPNLSVVGVERQETTLTAQSPAGYALDTADLQGCQTTTPPPSASPANQAAVAANRIAVRSEQLVYGGRVVVKRKTATVVCSTVTNLRVTPRSIEETILFDYTIRDASVGQLSILFPDRLRDARLDVPVPSARQVEEVAERPGWVRVSIRLHDEKTGLLRLLLEHSRPLGASTIEVQPPVIEQSQSGGQFIVVENTGGAELKADRLDGLEPLVRQQQDWSYLTGILRSAPTEAYRVRPGAAQPSVTLAVVERERLATVAAQILLSHTRLALDASGAYRGVQTYSIDNKTEPYLVVELPPGATLWSALVAGEAVKPVSAPAAVAPGTVMIPLVRTSEGDLDYPVVLKYGGSLGPMRSWGSVSLPFMRTKNVNVELSQVEVYLPEQHRWYGFDGSMRRMDDAGEYQATSFSYQTKRTERLNRALASGDEFTRIRALGNVDQLRGEVAQQQQAQQLDRNEFVQEQLQENARAVQELEFNAKVAREKLNQSQSLTVDNQAVLADQYRRQQVLSEQPPTGPAIYLDTKVYRALSESRTKAAAGTKPAPGKEADFDKKWLEGNKLEAEKRDESAKEKSESKPQAVEQSAGKRAESGELKKFAAPPTPPMGAPASTAPVPATTPAPANAAEDRRLLDRKGASSAVPALQSNQPAKPNDVVNRYQLQRGAQVDGKPGEGRAAGGGGGAGFGAASDKQSLVINGVSVADSNLASAVPAPQGFVSLDVEIPQRGQAFRFTTTRGDLRLVARSVSRHWFDSLSRLAAVLAAIVVLGLIVKAVRAPRVARLSDSYILGVVLLAVGLLMACSGFLAVIGLLLLLGGIAVLARAARRNWLEETAAVV